MPRPSRAVPETPDGRPDRKVPTQKPQLTQLDLVEINVLLKMAPRSVRQSDVDTDDEGDALFRNGQLAMAADKYIEAHSLSKLELLAEFAEHHGDPALAQRCNAAIEETVSAIERNRGRFFADPPWAGNAAPLLAYRGKATSMAVYFDSMISRIESGHLDRLTADQPGERTQLLHRAKGALEREEILDAALLYAEAGVEPPRLLFRRAGDQAGNTFVAFEAYSVARSVPKLKALRASLPEHDPELRDRIDARLRQITGDAAPDSGLTPTS